MTLEDFQILYPLLAQWMGQTLRAHAALARPVASAGFQRLPLYYRLETLAYAKFIVVDRPPTPPLASWGLVQFADFERMEPAGITYLDTYFVHRGSASEERLHFHELIHVMQWTLLGPEEFLRRYAEGLEKHGYRDSPLEVMAYDAEARFVQSASPFDAELYVREELAKLSR